MYFEKTDLIIPRITLSVKKNGKARRHQCYDFPPPLDNLYRKVDNVTIQEVKPLITFREALAQDAGMISHIYASSWRKAYRGLVADHYLDRLPDDYWVPAIRSWLESGRFMGLIIYEEKQPVGCAVFGRGRDEDHGDWGEIVSLYLLPDYARRGYGTQLLNKALEHLRQEGFSRFYLWCFANNAAADAFYRRMDFKATTDHNTFPIGGETVREIRYVLVER